MTDNEEDFESQDDRRAYDRSRLIVDVFFDGHDVTGVASTKDISLGGLYMNTQANFPVGAMLLVRIPFRPEAEVVCRAEVIYTEPGRGVGLRFSDVSDEGRAILEREISNA
ncbi:MAG TPA: PilZ domain-containing protein [Pyrinomonadaceae bacterium]